MNHMSRFIKYFPNEKAHWLLENHPNAFLLLTLIAQRARRSNKDADGFEIGWALIGDHEKAGLTRQQYRTALDVLVEHQFIEIICRGWKDKTATIESTIKTTIKATIKATIKKRAEGTIVKLIDSSIWDINPENKKIEATIESTTKSFFEQPKINHKQESEEAFSLEKESDKEKEASKVVAIRSLFDEKSEESNEDAFVFVKAHNLKISDYSLNRWVDKWQNDYVLAQLKILKERNVDRHEAFMEIALREDYAGQPNRIENNRRYAQDFKESYQWNSLKITKNYCRDEETGNDYQFFLRENQFQDMLYRALSSKREREEVL